MRFSQILKHNGLEVVVVKLPSPFPQANEINVYLFPEEGVMIDAGVRTREAREVLFSEMEKNNLPKSEVRRIYLTHGHPDHAGNVAHIQRHSGARIYLHEEEIIRITRRIVEKVRNEREMYFSFFRRIGVPDEMIETIAQMNEGIEIAMSFVNEDGLFTLKDGDTFWIGNHKVEVLHVPGHTPGMLNFYFRECGVLFSGDHILPTITPNPILELGNDGRTRRSLINYFTSLEKVKKLESLSLILPGHGDVIYEPVKTISSLLDFYLRRKEFIYRKLRKMGRATPAELVNEVFPNTRKTDYFLAISEIVGNLEMLEEEGRIVKENDSEYIFYSISKHC